MVNVLLAFAIYIGILFTWGETYLPAKNVTYGVVCDSIFTKMGMEKGDKIIALDHKEIERFNGIIPEMLLNRPQTIQVIRDGKEVSLDVPETFIADLLEISSRSYQVAPLLMPRQPVDGVEIGEFAEYSPAYDAGMRKGDKILSINDSSFHFYDEFTDLVEANRGGQVKVQALRGVDTLVYNFQLASDGKLGFFAVLGENTFQLKTRYYTFFEAVPAGIKMGETVEITLLTRKNSCQVGRRLCVNCQYIPRCMELG